MNIGAFGGNPGLVGAARYALDVMDQVAQQAARQVQADKTQASLASGLTQAAAQTADADNVELSIDYGRWAEQQH